MIALPDFELGAMENWGLITYREKYLLHDPDNYDIGNKIHVARVVAHELAHMVTPRKGGDRRQEEYGGGGEAELGPVQRETGLV